MSKHIPVDVDLALNNNFIIKSHETYVKTPLNCSISHLVKL